MLSTPVGNPDYHYHYHYNDGNYEKTAMTATTTTTITTAATTTTTSTTTTNNTTATTTRKSFLLGIGGMSEGLQILLLGILF